MNVFTRFAHDARRFFRPKNMKVRLRSPGKIFPIVAYTGLCLWVLLFLFLLIWALLSSLKTNFDFVYNVLKPPQLRWQWDNYVTAIREVNVVILRGNRQVKVGYLELLMNTLLLCIFSPLFALIDVAMCSYVTSKYRHFKGTRIIFAIVVFVNFVPLSASLATQLRLLKALGLYDHIWGMWIWSSGGFGAFFLIYYASFKSLSWTYAEAAFVDGAGHFRVFWQIMLPMTRGTFGALFITNFITSWTDYMTALIYLPHHPVLAYAAWAFQFSAGTAASLTPVKLAGMFTLAAPVLLLFLCFHKKLIGSMTIGGLKG